MSYINQAQFTVKSFSIQELLNMSTSVNGEQSPVNDKRVAIILDSFIDQPLMTPLKVVTFEGVDFLAGGRHRTASLAQEYADDLSKLVNCLHFTAANADEVVYHTTCDNGSRSMNAAEKKELTTAAKFGFDVVSPEVLVAAMCVIDDAGNRVMDMAEIYDKLTLALALQLDSNYECGKLTALTVARTIVTKLKKFNKVVTHPAKLDTDGTQLTCATTEKVNVVSDALRNGGESMHELLDALTFMIDYMESSLTEVPAKLYMEAVATGLNIVESDVAPTVYPTGTVFNCTVTRPTAWQRNAAKWMKVAALPMKTYISESLDITIA